MLLATAAPVVVVATNWQVVDYVWDRLFGGTNWYRFFWSSLMMTQPESNERVRFGFRLVAND